MSWAQKLIASFKCVCDMPVPTLRRGQEDAGLCVLSAENQAHSLSYTRTLTLSLAPNHEAQRFLMRMVVDQEFEDLVA